MGEGRVGENFSHSSNCPGISGIVPDFLPYPGRVAATALCQVVLDSLHCPEIVPEFL